MKTKCKRLLSLLLVFVLVLGLMPSVYAATDEGTQPTTEPAVTEATTETAGEDPTVPETTGATEPTDPSESTEGTEATEELTESEEDWTQPPEDDGMSLEEWDQLRFDALSCELPAPIEEYFPFDPSIQYPYGIPVENFYPSEVLGENPFGVAMFASDPYAVAPLADMSAIPENMYDNAILRALEYTGYDVQWLSYNKKDVIIEFFTDAACTDLLDSWDESDGMFAVTYSTTSANESVMTIKMTAQGLKEINTNKRVYTGASMVNSGYSDCTIRITYKATMHSDDSVVYGDSGNPNEVVLLWKRSSQDYYDTLVDDAHVYTYAMELTKLFSDGNGNFENVEFIMQNDSDGYFVKAELNEEEGIYYVVDHVENEADATHFVPVIPKAAVGPLEAEPEYKVIVKGLEDDNYTVTEVRTDDGYTLLKDDIKIVISQVETTELCDIYASDVLGLVQNDPRYATIINDTGDLKNMPQKHLEHHLLTASATVDGNDVNMLEDDGSINAVVPLKVVNTRGFDLPQTGDHGTWMFSVIGIMLMAGAAVVIIMTSRKKRTADQ